MTHIRRTVLKPSTRLGEVDCEVVQIRFRGVVLFYVKVLFLVMCTPIGRMAIVAMRKMVFPLVTCDMFVFVKTNSHVIKLVFSGFRI